MTEFPLTEKDQSMIEGFNFTKAYLYEGYSVLKGKTIFHCRDIFEYSLPPEIKETIIVSGKTPNLKPKLYIFEVVSIEGIDRLGNLMLHLLKKDI